MVSNKIKNVLYVSNTNDGNVAGKLGETIRKL